MLANPAPGQSRFVSVEHTEEKGSDVNLAAHLLCDAFDRDFEAAVVVSNDSDLVEPIKLVRAKLACPSASSAPPPSPARSSSRPPASTGRSARDRLAPASSRRP